MFDILTYEKGASVLRMFEQWAGPERFRSGIGAYLRAHSYSNTETADLWTSLSEATNTDVVAIMDSWINQGGHPLITASPTPHGVLLHQTRFRNLNGSAPDATWQVPIRIRAEVDGTTVRRSVLHSGEPLAVDLGGTPTQVTINEEASGFYRSEYQSPWATSVLTTAPESSPAEQIGILDDLWALFSAGRSSIEPLAVLLRGLLTAEASPLVWRRASGILGQLVALTPIDHVGLQHYWRDLAQELAVPTWKTLERTSEPSHAQQEVRALSIALAGTVGAYGPARQEAARLFALQTTSARHSTGDPELDAAVLHIVAASSHVSELRALRRRSFAPSMLSPSSILLKHSRLSASCAEWRSDPRTLPMGLHTPLRSPRLDLQSGPSSLPIGTSCAAAFPAHQFLA
jgi:puromycin-sensitive aminopeptidase